MIELTLTLIVAFSVVLSGSTNLARSAFRSLILGCCLRGLVLGLLEKFTLLEAVGLDSRLSEVVVGLDSRLLEHWIEEFRLLGFEAKQLRVLGSIEE